MKQYLYLLLALLLIVPLLWTQTRTATPPPIAPLQRPVQTAPIASLSIGSGRSDGSATHQPAARIAPTQFQVTPLPPHASTRAQTTAPSGPAPIIPEPLAREALAYVGTDAEAESIWLEAINDPALSAGQRRNLIEDLNEDGFPNPKRITLDDVPLIQSRLLLIDQLAAESLDDVNAEAFDEAKKDLENMLTKLGLR
jgi:hypothetical protein